MARSSRVKTDDDTIMDTELLIQQTPEETEYLKTDLVYHKKEKQ